MKRCICSLLVIALLFACAALAEPTPEVRETLEIIAVEVAPVSSRTPQASATASVQPTAKATESSAPQVSQTPEATADATGAPAQTGAFAGVKASPSPSAAPAATGPVTLAFEDGFTLEFPEGWLYHEISDEMAELGVYYALSDATGACQLYIQSWLSDCADMNTLKELIDRATHPQTSGVYSFNGTDFVVYDLSTGDVSCCAALKDGRVLNFVFTPQSDPDFMLTAAQIMSSYTALDF